MPLRCWLKLYVPSLHLAVAPAGTLLSVLTPCAWFGGWVAGIVGCVGTKNEVGVGVAVGVRVSVGSSLGVAVGIAIDVPCAAVWLGLRLNKAKLRKKRATIEKQVITLCLSNQLVL